LTGRFKIYYFEPAYYIKPQINANPGGL